MFEIVDIIKTTIFIESGCFKGSELPTFINIKMNGKSTYPIGETPNLVGY